MNTSVFGLLTTENNKEKTVHSEIMLDSLEIKLCKLCGNKVYAWFHEQGDDHDRPWSPKI